MTPMNPLNPVIAADSFVTLHYRISLPDSLAATADASSQDFLNTFADKPATLQMAAGQLAPSLEACLLGLAEGEHRVFDLAAGIAYGPRNPALLQSLSLKVLTEQSEAGSQWQPGDMVEFAAPSGGRYAGVLKEIGPDAALFDFNHPLAGQAICFEVKVIGVL